MNPSVFLVALNKTLSSGEETHNRIWKRKQRSKLNTKTAALFRVSFQMVDRKQMKIYINRNRLFLWEINKRVYSLFYILEWSVQFQGKYENLWMVMQFLDESNSAR